MNSGERGMNHVAMTIINPRKEFGRAGGSNQRPPVLKSSIQPTELRGLGKPTKVTHVVITKIWVNPVAVIVIIPEDWLVGCIGDLTPL